MRITTSHHREQGASTVEMAFLFPFLLLVLFAVAEYGRFFYLQSMASSVAAGAARKASLPGETDSSIAEYVTGRLNNGPAGTPPGFGLSVTPSVSVTPATRESGEPVTVTLSYPFVPMILPQFVGAPLFPDTIAAGASAVMEP